MTLIVGFIAEDGALIASDSEASESGHSRYDVEKIWTIGGLAFGYSGSGATRQNLQHILETNLETYIDANKPDRWGLKDYLVSLMQPIIQSAYANYVGPNYMQIAGTLLVVGKDDNGCFLLEIDANNTATFYDERRFHAIGSGSPAAYAVYSLIENYDSKHQSIEQLKLVSHRMLDSCINVIAGSSGVGGNIDIWLSQDEEFLKLDAGAIELIRYGVDQWKLSEKETLDKLYSSDDQATLEDDTVTMPDELQLQPEES